MDIISWLPSIKDDLVVTLCYTHASFPVPIASQCHYSVMWVGSVFDIYII